MLKLVSADLFIVIDSPLRSLPAALHRFTVAWFPFTLLDYCLKQDYTLDNTTRFSVYNHYPCTNLFVVVRYLVSSFYLSGPMQLSSGPMLNGFPTPKYYAYIQPSDIAEQEPRLFHDWTDPPVALTSLARCNGCGKCMLMHADLAQL